MARSSLSASNIDVMDGITPIREKKMSSNRDMLYRSVLRQSGGCSSSMESPGLVARDLSPMSSLALSFHQSAPFSNTTPRRKLSLSSDLSDSSFSSIDLTPGKSHDHSSSSGDQDCSVLTSPTRKTFGHFKDEYPSPCSDEATLMSPPLATNILSPSRRLMNRNKENFPSPYFSPSHSTHIPHRPRSSPLQDVQNTVNRNLTFSPLKKRIPMLSPSKRMLTSPHKPSPPEDFDTNSQDSGYSESGKKFDDTCFSVPVSCAPRKLNLDTPPKVQQAILSPNKAVTCTSSSASSIVSAIRTGTLSRTSDSTYSRFSSLNKPDEEDSMLMDLLNDSPNKDDQPFGFSRLISEPIKESNSTQPSPIDRPSTIKRCLSMVDITPTSSRFEPLTTSNGHAAENRYGRFKRPEAPSDLSNLVDCKKRRQELSPLQANAPTSVVSASILTQRQVSAPEASSIDVPKPKIFRSHSESHVSIMKALNKCSNHNGELTGDFSKPIALPTIEGGKHPDLKAISVDTMSELLKGKYKEQIASFKIVDCRYPYEFNGGHIVGAEMFHHPQMIIDHLMGQKGSPVISKEGTPRHVLIFHCEFSAERGPRAQRLLREKDRTTNKEHYPALHFPETYLLEGGYKAFFEKYPELCTPQDYVKMVDPNHSEDLKHFRGKSKSWQAENKQSKNRNTLPRTGLKRLGL